MLEEFICEFLNCRHYGKELISFLRSYDKSQVKVRVSDYNEGHVCGLAGYKYIYTCTYSYKKASISNHVWICV